MNISIFTVVYQVLPWFAGLFAAAVYLTTRTIPSRRIWLLSGIMALLLTAGTTIAMNQAAGGAIPLSMLVQSYAALFIIPFVVLTGTALFLRSQPLHRALGIALLVALIVVTTGMARHIATDLFDLVNASG